jgi:hypothetical protein
MTADQNGEHRKTTVLGDAEELPVSDLPRLAEIITEFNRARTHSAIYPPHHPQIAESLDRAYQGIRDLIEGRPELTLGAAQDVLLLAGKPLDPRSSVFREFALALSSRNVLSITFERGLTRDDLLRLHQVLSRPPEEVLQAEGVRRLAAQAGVEHVRLQELDYSHFHLTEEIEVSPRGVEDEKARDDRIWRDFAGQILEGGGSAGRKPTRLPEDRDADPAELSAFINADPEGARAAMREYERLIARGGGGLPDPRTLGKLTVLLRSLRPELKSKFLAMTFEKMNETNPAEWEGFGDDLALQMLEQADEDKKMISPALMNLVQALSGMGKESPIQSAAVGPDGASPAPAENPFDKFDSFFVQESRESYMDPEYQAVLDHMSRAAAKGGTAGSGWQDAIASQFRETLEGSRIAVRLCHLLVAFLESTGEAEDYRAYSDKILGHVSDILDARDFELLLRILNTFKRHAAEKPSPLSELAEKALRAFAGPDFLSRAVRSLPSREGRSAASSAFFSALGPACIPGLLDLFVQDERQAGNGPLIRILGGFGAAGTEAAAMRFEDPRVDTVRRLVAFLKTYGTPASVPPLRDLRRHADDQVRSDALDARLALGDADAPRDLRAALHSPNDRESRTAIRLAGMHRVAGTAVDLARLIKAGGFLRGDNRRNEDIVRALGKIGDPVVLPVLEKAVRRMNLLSSAEHRDLKAAVFESLGGYPRESLAGILRLGMRAKDPRIRAACQFLQKEPSGTSSHPRAIRPEEGDE